MSIVTIVPLRSPGLGKTRLADRLNTDERAGLAGAMLADVVAAIRGCGLERVVLAASGPGAVAAGAALDLEVVLDPPDVATLDHAIEHARLATGNGHDVLVVLADLPALTAGDLEAMIEADTAVVVGPTDDGGTSALLRRPGDVIATCYGPDSARRHVEAATHAGLSVTTLERPGLRRDVDTSRDLGDLADHAVGPATARFLREHHRLLTGR
jgi:2-phospho-L-lactate guanylyltransferase